MSSQRQVQIKLASITEAKCKSGLNTWIVNGVQKVQKRGIKFQKIPSDKNKRTPQQTNFFDLYEDTIVRLSEHPVELIET